MPTNYEADLDRIEWRPMAVDQPKDTLLIGNRCKLSGEAAGLKGQDGQNEFETFAEVLHRRREEYPYGLKAAF